MYVVQFLSTQKEYEHWQSYSQYVVESDVLGYESIGHNQPDVLWTVNTRLVPEHQQSLQHSSSRV